MYAWDKDKNKIWMHVIFRPFRMHFIRNKHNSVMKITTWPQAQMYHILCTQLRLTSEFIIRRRATPRILVCCEHLCLLSAVCNFTEVKI